MHLKNESPGSGKWQFYPISLSHPSFKLLRNLGCKTVAKYCKFYLAEMSQIIYFPVQTVTHIQYRGCLKWKKQLVIFMYEWHEWQKEQIFRLSNLRLTINTHLIWHATLEYWNTHWNTPLKKNHLGISNHLNIFSKKSIIRNQCFFKSSDTHSA